MVGEETRDERTGARIRQLTSGPGISHHLYPLTCSTTADMEWVVFASNRSGRCQFYRTPFAGGESGQLTDDEGGVQGYSGHLTRDGRELIYTAGGRIRAVGLATRAARELHAWEGASLGEVSLSASGEWLVTAMKWQGRNHLAVARVDGGSAALILTCDRTIIHPQFHPSDDTLIEYARDPAPRMWLVRRDGSENTCLYDHGNEEFVVHETWLGRTGNLVYSHWPFALCRLPAAAGGKAAPEQVAGFNAWHIAPDRAGARILCDTNHPDVGLQLVGVATGERTTVCHPGASARGSQWRTSRYALKEDFERAGREEGALSWMEAKVDTVYGPQWTHPHPSWSADERWCLYDSDVTGTTQVYAVELPPAQEARSNP